MARVAGDPTIPEFGVSWWARLRGILGRWPVVSLVILAVLVIAGVFAPLIAPKDPVFADLRDRNAPPFWHEQGSGKYILGADYLGRDILSRVIHGARISLVVAAVSLSGGLLVGTSLGLVSGYVGGHADELIMRIVDVTQAIPYILIALVVVIVLGQSFPVLLGILAFSTWGAFARQVRAETLALREMDYVALAKVAGASSFRIMYRHILPGTANTIIVISTLRVGFLILLEATLSYLGAGIPPPTPAWGAMIADGRDYLATAWWVAFFPGVAIFLVVMALNFIGDWTRDRFDPRLRQL